MTHGVESLLGFVHAGFAFAVHFRYTSKKTGPAFAQTPCKPSSHCLYNKNIQISTLPYPLKQTMSRFFLSWCLSSIILSPLNGNVKMSPYETGDIHVESEGIAASERNQRMHQGRYGVCQSRRTPVFERAPD